MNWNRKRMGLGGFLATALLLAMDLSANDARPTGDFDLYGDLVKSCMLTVQKDCESWARSGGGGEAPRGLKADTKVELANNERYLLGGVIDVIAGDPYLRVDLREQPWLASRTRTKNPYYRIHDDLAKWKKLRGQSVSLLATVKYSVFFDAGRTLFEIVLVPGPEPIIPALQRNRR